MGKYTLAPGKNNKKDFYRTACKYRPAEDVLITIHP